jgi:hypothetical protein
MVNRFLSSMGITLDNFGAKAIRMVGLGGLEVRRETGKE